MHTHPQGLGGVLEEDEWGERRDGRRVERSLYGMVVRSRRTQSLEEWSQKGLERRGGRERKRNIGRAKDGKGGKGYLCPRKAFGFWGRGAGENMLALCFFYRVLQS